MKRSFHQFLIRLLRHKSPSTATKILDIRRILIIRRNRMGDMICTLPMIHSIREALPGVEIHVLCTREGYPIASHSADIQEAIKYKKGYGRWHELWLNRPALKGYDAVINAKGGFDSLSALMTAISGAPFTIGYEPIHKDHPSLYYSHPVDPQQRAQHQVDTCNRLGLVLGAMPQREKPEIFLSDRVDTFADEMVRKHSLLSARKILAINISCNRPGFFEEDVYRKLARRYLIRSGNHVVFLASPADIPKAQILVDDLAEPDACVIPTKNTLQLAAIISRCSVLFTPEGGSSHLAWLMDCPAVVVWIFNSTMPKWASLGKEHHHFEMKQDGTFPWDEVTSSLDRLMD